MVHPSPSFKRETGSVLCRLWSILTPKYYQRLPDSCKGKTSHLLQEPSLQGLCQKAEENREPKCQQRLLAVC